MKHEQQSKAEFRVHIPFKELMKIAGVPKNAEITYIVGGRDQGLVIYYEK